MMFRDDYVWQCEMKQKDDPDFTREKACRKFSGSRVGLTTQLPTSKKTVGEQAPKDIMHKRAPVEASA
jgi:hypothetical protein